MIETITVPARRAAPFTRLALSNLAAQMSEQIALVAIPMIAVTSFGAGGGATSLIQMLNSLPFLLFAIPFGLLVDRRPPGKVMAAGEAIRTSSLLLLFWLALTDNATVPILGLLGMAGSIGTVAYTIGAPTLVPRLVPSSSLASANGKIELCRSLAFAAGPALGGTLVGQTGESMAFLIAISLSSAALVLIIGLPHLTSANVQHARPLRQIVDGARFVRDHQYLRPIALTAVLFNTAWYCLQGVYVAYAIHRLGMTSAQTGLTLALYGVGMIVGSRLAHVLARRFPFSASIVIGPLFGAIASILILLTLLWPSMLLASIAFLMLGMGPIVWTISTTTLRQIVTPTPMLGRVTALIVTSTAGFRPVGAGLGAVAFITGGYTLVLVISTLGFIAQAVVILRSPAARIDSLASVESAPANKVGHDFIR